MEVTQTNSFNTKTETYIFLLIRSVGMNRRKIRLWWCCWWNFRPHGEMAL